MAATEFYDFAKDHPDILPIFAQNIDVVLKASTVMNQEPREIVKYSRGLLCDLTKAGKRIGESSIELTSTPLHLSTMARLTAVDGQTYSIEGTLLRSPQGHPMAVDVRLMNFLR